MASRDDTSRLQRQPEIDTCGLLGGSGGQWFWPRRYPHAYYPSAVVRSDSHHEHSTAVNLPSLQVREHLVNVVQPSFMDFSSDLTLRRECDCFC